MGWFNPAEGLSDEARNALERLANAGSSEAAGVADTLNTIAENGDGQESDDHLLGCAEELRDYAQAFIDEVGDHERKDIVQIRLHAGPRDGEHVLSEAPIPMLLFYADETGERVQMYGSNGPPDPEIELIVDYSYLGSVPIAYMQPLYDGGEL